MQLLEIPLKNVEKNKQFKKKRTVADVGITIGVLQIVKYMNVVLVRRQIDVNYYQEMYSINSHIVIFSLNFIEVKKI